MDDLSSKLSEMLSNPDSIRQIQEMAKSLNPGGGAGVQNAAGESGGEQSGGAMPSFDPAMLQGLMNAMNGQQNQSSQGGGIDPGMLQGLMNALSGRQAAPGTAPSTAQPSTASADNGQMMQMMSAFSKMAPMMQRLNQEDDSTRLLMALKPMLSPARQKKLDEAAKIMRMMRMIPLLRESGMMSSLF